MTYNGWYAIPPNQTKSNISMCFAETLTKITGTRLNLNIYNTMFIIRFKKSLILLSRSRENWFK